MEDLAGHRIWQYPYDRPHSYLVVVLEAYLDLYRATGERRYLDAALGDWDLFRDNWQNLGGALSIIEYGDYPPKSIIFTNGSVSSAATASGYASISGCICWSPSRRSTSPKLKNPSTT